MPHTHTHTHKYDTSYHVGYRTTPNRGAPYRYDHIEGRVGVHDRRERVRGSTTHSSRHQADVCLALDTNTNENSIKGT